MAQTRIRIGEQLQTSSNPRSILITDSNSKPSYFSPSTGLNRLFMWNDATSQWDFVVLGTNLSWSGTTLNATAGAGGYTAIQEEGVTVGASNTTMNFIGSGITAADAGGSVTSVTLNSFLNTLATSGSVNLASHVSGDLPYSNLAQGSALSVLGVTGNAIADNASIVAGTDHQVLRRSGTSVGFGAINLAQANAVTGILDETNGGTGQSLYAVGDLLYADTTTSLARRAAVASGSVLKSAGVSTAPIWGTLSTSDLTDGANIAHINATETISAVWTFNTLPESGVAPTTGNQLTNKTYVDGLFQGVRDYKESVRVASTANVTVTYNATGGTSARGQITAAPNTLNGVSLASGNRILLKNQSTGAQNGIWVVTTVGTGANGVWDRATDFDADAEVTSGATCYVSEFVTTDNRGTYVLTTSDPIIIGGGSGTALTFTQIDSPTGYQGGAGMVLNGLTFDVQGNAGRIIVNPNDIDLASGIVTAQSWGSASSIPVFTTDTYGRVTAVTPTTIAIASTNISDFNEAAQDAVGTILTDSGRIDFTYDDVANTITADIVTNSVTFAYMQQVGTDVLIGRDASGTGNLTTITLGTGLGWTGADQIIHADTSSVGNLDTSGAQVIDTMTFDGMGHVTAVTTRDITLDDVSGVVLTAPTTNQVLTYDGANWINQTAQGGTTVRAFIEGSSASTIDLDANTGVVKDVNGNNVAFTIPTDTLKFFVYRNGVRQMETGGAPGNTTRDYSVNTTTHVLTLTYALTTDEVIMVEKLN